MPTDATPTYPQPLHWLPILATNARYVAPRLVVADMGGANHHDLDDGPRYVLDLRDPCDPEDCASQRWRHPEHHTREAVVHLRLLPVVDGATVPTEAVAEAVAWYRDVRAVAPEALVVVHCFAGYSRSATAAYAILRACHGLDHAEALRRVQTRTEHFEKPRTYPHERIIADAVRWCDELAEQGAASSVLSREA